MKKLALVFASLMIFAPLSAFAQTQPDQNQGPTASGQTQADPGSSASDVKYLLLGGN